jgi:pimeloyl-ACP methyl ester carboxylesterase
MHDEICAAIPHARYVRVPDCGHLCTLEQATAITALVDYWWAGDSAVA